MYDLRIVVISTANDNGSQAASVSPQGVEKAIDLANQVYNPYGVNFLFDPATDIYSFNDDLLNRDMKRRDHVLYTNPDIEPDADPLLDLDLFNDHRNEIARRFPGRITIFCTWGCRYNWNDNEDRWVYGKRTFSWSNGFDEFVSMVNIANNLKFAHEVGHYLHLDHTFSFLPADMDDAIAEIKKFVDELGGDPNNVPKELFDGDKLDDTPPDPGDSLFNNPCDPGETSVTISVKYADGLEKDYTFTPDRENIMSYWEMMCFGGTPHISSSQYNKINDALRSGNRRHLIEPLVLYSGVWGSGDRSQTRAICWAKNDFAKRFNDELTALRHCVHMQAYDIGGGQIRYDGIWEGGGRIGQTRAICWAKNDFAKRFNDELAALRHCVHMQAYDIGGGQIRYDGIWEGQGIIGQTRAICWGKSDFTKRFGDELNANRHCVHMQAYDMGSGQIRYDGVWQDGGNKGQTCDICWVMQDFAKRFSDELNANRHCVHMQAYDIGGGQIRYDGVWESAGNKGQTFVICWAFNDFVRQWDNEAAAGRRIVHLQAYDIGGGQIRYDGIWEPAAGIQGRALSLPLATFADHFDEVTSSGYHIELMCACMRSYHEKDVQPTRPRSIRRNIFFGSDIDRLPASMDPLPIKPLSERGTGCELK